VKRALKIVLIEDDDNDVVRIHHELCRAGLSVGLKRVETEAKFLEALRKETPDIILSDHGLPSFDGLTALEITQKQHPNIPFIFVTGRFDLRMVVDMIERGAAGCVYKNRLSELVPAIEEALDPAVRQPPPPEQELVREPAPLSTAHEAEAVPLAQVVICSTCKRVQNQQGAWEPLERFLLRHGEATVRLSVCPDCGPTQPLRSF